jgi:hypothetical protein
MALMRDRFIVSPPRCGDSARPLTENAHFRDDFCAEIVALDKPSDRFVVAEDHELPRVFQHGEVAALHFIQKFRTPDTSFGIPDLATDHSPPHAACVPKRRA